MRTLRDRVFDALVGGEAVKYWVYQGRHGELELFPDTDAGWKAARAMQDADNRCTLEEIRRDLGDDAIAGAREYGRFSIDEGGELELVEVTEC